MPLGSPIFIESFEQPKSSSQLETKKLQSYFWCLQPDNLGRILAGAQLGITAQQQTASAPCGEIGWNYVITLNQHTRNRNIFKFTEIVIAIEYKKAPIIACDPLAMSYHAPHFRLLSESGTPLNRTHYYKPYHKSGREVIKCHTKSSLGPA